MTWSRLPWMWILIPAACTGAFEAVRHRLLAGWPMWVGNLACGMVALGASLAYYALTYRRIARLVFRLQQQEMEAARYQERERIAAELHDNISQTLFFCKVRLRALRQELDQGQAKEAAQAVQELGETVESLWDEVRKAIFALKTVDHPQEPLAAALRRRVLEFARQAGVEVDLQLAAALDRPEGPFREHVQAIVQEALWNVWKHSGATRVQVRAEREGTTLRLTISDNGTGFDAQRWGPGYGLEAMHRRAREAGGKLQVHSVPGEGTVIDVALPWTEGGPLTRPWSKPAGPMRRKLRNAFSRAHSG